MMPDPSHYYIKDFPGYTPVYAEVEITMPKYSRPICTTKNNTREGFREYLCEPCHTKFYAEDDRSQHVTTSH
jgi:hypothetical protein